MAFHHVRPSATHFDNDLKMAHAATSHHSWSNLYEPPTHRPILIEISCYEPPSVTTKRSSPKWTIICIGTQDSQHHRPTTREWQSSGVSQYEPQLVCSLMISNITDHHLWSHVFC